MTPDSCREAERNMGLIHPQQPSVVLEEGGVESPFCSIPLAPCSLPLFLFFNNSLSSPLLRSALARVRFYIANSGLA